MTYTETIEYLYTLLPVFHRQGPAALKPGLDNTLAICQALGNPESKFKSIHIAGTNGKGSVSNMLASVLQASGITKVGLYTSPHIKSFTERIRISGKEIPEAWIVDFVEKHKPILHDVKPSFFEFTVGMCFAYFAEKEVDIAIIETGLGGRLDSTNVITPILSIITNISWDHKELLGDTLGKIATEKAGIIKKGVPVVIGSAIAETEEVFRKKVEYENAPIVFAKDIYAISQTSWNYDHQGFEVKNNISNKILHVETDLVGAYQQENISTVLAATEKLQQLGLPIHEKQVLKGLKKVKANTGFYGRFDVISQQPITIVDVAHNPAGMQSLIEQVSKIKYNQLHIVFGVVKDKDVASVLNTLPKEAVYYYVQPNLPRALDSVSLSALGQSIGLLGKHFETVQAGYFAAKENANPKDIILITGSFFVVAEIY